MLPQEYIHSLGRFSGKPGLHRIRALCEALGNPQRKLRFVHIAGTNGKGSTAAMIAEIAQAAGYDTGLYTSPYLVVFHERIRVNGQMIPDEALQRLTKKVSTAAKHLNLPSGERIGEFEFVTAVAMLYFLEQACDLVVLETGLGGEFDATNVIEAPIVTVLTSISLDHTAVLGESIEEIAQTKAGIIKAGTEVICARGQAEAALQVIRTACANRDVSLHEPQAAEILSMRLDGTSFRYRKQDYNLALIGRHQIENSLTAIHAAYLLRDRGFAISEEAIATGLSRVRFAGRLERVKDRPLMLLDGAHNPGGIDALCRTLDEYIAGQRIFAVIGMVADKAVQECVDALAGRCYAIYAAAPDSERALSSDALATLAARGCARVKSCGTAEHALLSALGEATETDCILVCGSLYLVGEVKKLLSVRHNALK